MSRYSILLSQYASVIFITGLLFLSGCYQPKEGCLDLSATNFDANADKDCCCTYPQLRLNITQRYGANPFTENGLYLDAANHPFYLRNVSYYLSDFEILQQGKKYKTLDTIGLYALQPGTGQLARLIFRDDFVLVRRSSVNNDAGVTRQEGIFNGLRFRLGVTDSAQWVLPNRAPTSHPLYQQTDSLWRQPNGYVFLQLIVARDTTRNKPNDTLSFSRKDLPGFFIEETGLSIHKKLGANLEFSMLADYQKMLEGINWTVGDKNTWKNQIKANLIRTFSVK